MQMPTKRPSERSCARCDSQMNNEPVLPVGVRVTDPCVAARPKAQVHTGMDVVLRPIDVDLDTDSLFAAGHGADQEWIWTYMPYGPFDDRAQMRAWLQESSESADPRFFTVCQQPDAKPVGMVSYLSIAAEHRSIEVGHIWYSPQVQRTTVNTESIFLLLQHAFNDLGYRRVEWKCDVLNARSCAAAERLGFRPEGIFKQHRIVRSRNRDTAWFAMMDHDWPSIQQAIRTWLGAPQSDRGSLRELTAS
jgi:RimJ/RimL family protein N-acetyltransferase